MVVIEVEVKDGRIGRIRVSRTENASGECLLRFVQESVEKGSTVNTDGWQGYNKLSESVYTHKVTIAQLLNLVKKSELLPHVHLIISLLIC